MYISRILLILFFSLKIGFLFGQKKVDKLYNDHAYAAVISKFEKLLQKDSLNCELIHKLAVSYAHLNNSEAALEHYSHIISLGKSSILDDYDWNKIGQLYLRYENQNKAEMAFSHLIDSNEFFGAQQKPKQMVVYQASNLESINTVFSEFSPFVINNQFVFTSDRSFRLYGNTAMSNDEKSYLSIFGVENDTVLSRNKIKRFSGKINSGFENGTASFSSDGKKVFYTKSTSNETGIHHSKIYAAEKIKKKWKNIHSISLNDEAFSMGHPVFIDSLNMLVFSSDMPGGYGGMDMYYSYLVDGEWTDPLNFGPMVNTRFNEVFPSKNSTRSDEIYFSSNGRYGYGGLDVYKMVIKNNKVVSVTILPTEINSNQDDFGIFFVSETAGYVSSDRKKGKGGDDIYGFSLKSKPIPLIQVKPFEFSGSIFDEETGLPIVDHKMYLLDVDNMVIDSTHTDIEGRFDFKKPPFMDVTILPDESEEREVSIKMKSTASKDNANGLLYLMSSNKTVVDSVYLAEGEVLTFYMESNDEENKHKCVVYEDGKKAVKIVYVMRDSAGLILDSADYTTACLTIRKIYPEKEMITLLNDEDVVLSIQGMETLFIPKEKDTIIVERVYFELERVAITDHSKKSLSKIVHVLKEHPSVKVNITGHTDSRGEEAYNLELSKKRSKEILKHLVSEGIDANRLTAEGMGESKLANHCKDGIKCSEKEHAQNRRTEFEITWE